MAEDFETTNLDPSSLYIKEMMDQERFVVQLQMTCQSEVYDKNSMPKGSVLSFASALKSYYYLLRPTLTNEEEEDIDKKLDDAKEKLNRLSRARSMRVERRRAEDAFEDLSEIFGWLLKYKNRHDLSIKTKRELE